jgi:hypothetical protein
MTELTQDLAARFASLALGHVTREYPNKLDHVMAGPEDVKGPRALHPIFYGSFDWHSCVHGWWTMARTLRLFPDMAPAAQMRALFDEHLTFANVAAEVAYLARPASRGFERPYGWAWLLMLQAELARHDTDEGRRWAGTLKPLAEAFAGRFRAFLPIATYPVRAGTHFSTAFALALACEYAEVCGDSGLKGLLWQTALRWYENDRACQAWEPSGDDFLSPALIEAECMRRLLPASAFTAWFAAFLPDVADHRPATLFEPATVSDRTDGKIAHLDGLNLSRAWCWKGIAAAVEDEAVRRVAEEASAQHLAAGLPHVAGDYMGEHWLASFALLALTA